MSAAHSSLVAAGPCSSSKTKAPPLGVAAKIAAASSARLSSGRRERDFANLTQVNAGKTRASGALRQSLEVAIEQQALWPRLQSAHANQREAHVQISAASALGGFARPIGAPHLLKVIEPANVWTENVHDRILRIEQHPIAKRHAFNFR